MRCDFLASVILRIIIAPYVKCLVRLGEGRGRFPMHPTYVFVGDALHSAGSSIAQRNGVQIVCMAVMYSATRHTADQGMHTRWSGCE